jgi:hypothetical protein
MHAGLGLALHGRAQTNPVWRGVVGHFIQEFKTTSHVSATALRKKPHLAFE